MSRPQKKHKPLKAGFNDILAAVALSRSRAKRAANELLHKPSKQSKNESATNPGESDKKM
jgi:hypothetical protein